MKKFLRFIIVLLVIVAAAVIVLAVIEPKDVNVTRTILINAPKDVVFDQIVKFKNWNNWSPWYKMDSGKMKMTYYGTDGTPGSGYTWEGDKTGAGDMHDSMVTGTNMQYQLTFTKPHGGSAWGNLKAEDTAGMTKVTWTCNMHFGAPSNAMLVFMNMEKMLGPDFENGLKNMKEYVESRGSGAAQNDAAIKEVDFPGHMYQGERKVVGVSDILKFCGEGYNMMKEKAKDRITGPATGLYFSWDTVKHESDIAAVFPVPDTTKPVKGLVFTYVPAAKAVMTVLNGGYGKEMEAHAAISKYMAAKNMQSNGLVVEEYITGPNNEPDSNKWVTKIYYLLN